MLASAWFASVLFLPNLAFRDSEQQQGKTVLGSSDTIARSLESAHGSKEGLSVDLFHHTASSLEDAQRLGVDASGGASDEVPPPDKLQESIAASVAKAEAFSVSAKKHAEDTQQKAFAVIMKTTEAAEPPPVGVLDGLKRATEAHSFAGEVKDLTTVHNTNVQKFFAAVQGFTQVQENLVQQHEAELAAQKEAHDEGLRLAEERNKLSRDHSIESLEKALNESQNLLAEQMSERREQLDVFERSQTIQEVEFIGQLLDDYGSLKQSQRALQKKKEDAEAGNITGTGAAEIHELVSSSTEGITQWGNAEVAGTCRKYGEPKFQELFPAAIKIMKEVKEREGTTAKTWCRRFVRSFLLHQKEEE